MMDNSSRTLTLRTNECRAAGGTDRGQQRSENEDRYAVDPVGGIFLVVDGVGGHVAGEIAADLAVKTILARLGRSIGSPEERVRQAITLANNEIFRQAREVPAYAGMACVVTLALLADDRLTIGHVGDSRMYKLTPADISKLTHDHSPIGQREDAQELSELEAMQHPRRNEVFRDVGSAPHEPGDEDFIELVACGFEDDAAILLCSDGLSDMLTAIEIQRIVRLHAGDPGAVVEALVTAANAAGGKDNVTVVYAEGLKFPRSRAAVDDTLPLLLPAQESMAEPARGTSRGFFRRVIERRAVAFAAGVIAGIVVALLIAGSRDRTSEMPGSRRLVVGGDAPGHYRTITDALAKARARDVVLVEPGEYPEELLLTDDVDVIARVPGAAVLTALPGRQNWTSVLAVRGRGLVRGLRIAGSTEAPIHVGIRVSAGNIEIDDVALTGLIATGIDIRGDSSVLVRASRFERLSGMPLRIAAAATTDIRQNYFIAANAGQSPAIEVSDDSKSLFDGNLFVHFGEIVMPPSGLRDALLATSFVIPIVLNR